MSLPVERLAWDSQHFGLPIARISDSAPDAATLGAVVGWARAGGIACLYFLADDEPKVVAAAEAHGFHFVDVRLTLDRTLDDLPDLTPPRATLRAPQPGDTDTLTAIAAASYTQTRFAVDERFAPARVSAMYRTWMQRSLAGELADYVLVAALDGTPVGFVTASRVDATTAHIGLVGVADAARGRQLGLHLLHQALHHYAGLGCTRMTVVTQGRNIAAQRLYQKAGFRTAERRLWYHLWPGTPHGT